MFLEGSEGALGSFRSGVVRVVEGLRPGWSFQPELSAPLAGRHWVYG
jgi:hypothetical protein